MFPFINVIKIRTLNRVVRPLKRHRRQQFKVKNKHTKLLDQLITNMYDPLCFPLRERLILLFKQCLILRLQNTGVPSVHQIWEKSSKQGIMSPKRKIFQDIKREDKSVLTTGNGERECPQRGRKVINFVIV